MRILPNINAVKELQRGHGGWGDQMEYVNITLKSLCYNLFD